MNKFSKYYIEKPVYKIGDEVIYNYEVHSICFFHSCGLVNLKGMRGFYKYGVHKHSLTLKEK